MFRGKAINGAGDLRCGRCRRRVRSYTPRNVLKNVLSLYKEKGWKPVVAPEIEFYLVAMNDDPDYPLHPPKGRSGRSIVGGQSYSIAGINEFDELIDDIYHFSEKQGLEIDTLIHEEGPAQLEINLRHGDPIELADQVFLFKRTIREAALKHGIYATFMAKPMQGQPGSAMHIHQSVIEIDSGRNIFSNKDGSASGSSSRSLAACSVTYRTRWSCWRLM